MPVVRMPNGDQVQFPDDMPKEQIREMIATKFPDSVPTERQSVPAPGFTGTTAAAQAGLAQGATFGFADEILAGMMAPIEQGIDLYQGKGFDLGRSYNQALDKTRGYTKDAQESSPKVALGADIAGSLMTGGQLAKGGATLMAGAKPTIASMATRGAAEGALYGAAQGAGRGEGLQDKATQAVAGGAVGGVLGGVTGAVGGAFAQNAASKATPEIDDLHKVVSKAYEQVDKSGARYSAAAIDDLYDDILIKMSEKNISPTRHPKAYSMLADLEKRRGNLSLTQVDQLRQEVSRDLLKSSDASERFFGNIIKDSIDDFVSNAGQAQMVGGNAAAAAKSIEVARKANTILRKSEVVQEAIDKATRRVQSTGSGGNIDNALRQEIRKILDSASKSRGFTAAEKAAMEKIVEGGGKAHDLLRLIGKFSPSGSGLMAALGLGSVVANPAMSVPVGAGIAAKALSDNATMGGINALTNAVRTGGAAATKVPYGAYPPVLAVGSQVPRLLTGGIPQRQK